MVERSDYFRPKRQDRLFEKMLFGMRFSHLKMWFEGKKRKPTGSSLVKLQWKESKCS